MSHLKIQRSPQCFQDSVQLIMGYVRQEMAREATEKGLYFHNFSHVQGVRRRAERIFEVVRPYWQDELNQLHDPLDLERMGGLLSLAAVAHDMVQEFLPREPWTARRRAMGTSEYATIDKLLAAIADLNADLQQQQPQNPDLQFASAECDILREAIAATICDFDPGDRAIFQPYLYTNIEKSPVAIMLALADIGALAIEGIVPFRQEGREIFLEENPDFVPLVLHPQKLDQYPAEKQEELRQNLLKRAQFQIGFAQGRCHRLQTEIRDLPRQSLDSLKTNVFSYTNGAETTLATLVSTTPTAATTTLSELLSFFAFDQVTDIFNQSA